MVVFAIILAPAVVSNVSGVAAAVVIVAVVLPSAKGVGVNRLGRALEWAPVRFLGAISFSLYLWHLPIIFWLMKHHLTAGDKTSSLPLTGIFVLAIAVPLSSITYYFVEKPAMRMKKPVGKIATPSQDKALVAR